jgi:hypothetical protein
MNKPRKSLLINHFIIGSLLAVIIFILKAGGFPALEFYVFMA